VAAGRPAADINVAAIEAEVPGAVGEEDQRLADLCDDVGQPRVGRERVSGNGDVDAVRARARRHKGEPLLLIALPVAAVDEHKQRRMTNPARKVVECGPRTRAVAQVETGPWLRADRGTRLPPARAIVRLSETAAVLSQATSSAGRSIPR
jgi:hypothetical protein